MKHLVFSIQNSEKKYVAWFFSVIFLLMFFIPMIAFGANDFVSLAPIPNLDTGNDATLGSYINSMFLLVISVAAMLAVLRIVFGGFQYMTQEAVTDQQNARVTIQNAVIGLLLLLGVYLILSVINPQILDFNSFKSSLTNLQKDRNVPATAPATDRSQVSRNLSAEIDVRAMRSAGFDDEVETGIRNAAGFSCTNASGSDCSQLAYQKISIVYHSDFVTITVQDLNDPDSPTYGQFVTKRVGYEAIKTSVCGSASSSKQIPGC